MIRSFSVKIIIWRMMKPLLTAILVHSNSRLSHILLTFLNNTTYTTIPKIYIHMTICNHWLTNTGFMYTPILVGVFDARFTFILVKFQSWRLTDASKHSMSVLSLYGVVYSHWNPVLDFKKYTGGLQKRSVGTHLPQKWFGF